MGSLKKNIKIKAARFSGRLFPIYKYLRNRLGIKINYNEELNNMIIYEQNRQLNKFSNLYFNKLKKNANITDE